MLDDLAGKRTGERIRAPARAQGPVPADAGQAGRHIRFVAEGHRARYQAPAAPAAAVAQDHGVIAFDSATGIVAAITERD